MMLARAGALSVSVGILALLMFRAGLGCSGTPEPTRDATSASTSAPIANDTGTDASANTEASATPPASAAPVEFMGGTKSGVDPQMLEKLMSSSPSTAPASSAGSAPSSPAFFPGTKSAPVRIQRQEQNPAPQGQ